MMGGIFCRNILFPTLMLAAFSGCLNSTPSTSVGQTDPAGNTGGTTGGGTSGGGGGSGGSSGSAFTISGTVFFDWVPAKDSYTEGGVQLDYAAELQLPARRVRVEAITATGGTLVTSTSTDDTGSYSLSISNGSAVKVRVVSQMVTSSNTRDGTGPENCLGASWNVKVVDNTASQAVYALTSSSSYSATTSSVNFTPRITRSTGASPVYTDRSAAPFALLDTALREIELVCQGNAAQAFPSLKMNWSSANTSSASGNAAAGQIGTSYYTNEGGTSGPNLYILGKEGEDTDEFDDHVVAHEFGHYLEDQIYRSDSIGGPHGTFDSLDPRLAFGEGFGNAISAMTYDDPVYVDTKGARQSTGFAFSMSTLPTGHDRTVFSETSVQHVLWRLFKQRVSFDRIHTVLADDHRATPTFTTLLSFAAYYRHRYVGGATSDDTLSSTLWPSTLATPLDALCVGVCPAGAPGTLDPYDSNADIAAAYASDRVYPAFQGTSYLAGFWELYPKLSFGASYTGDHNQTRNGGYGAAAGNKLGMNRLYRYEHSVATGSVTISVSGITCGTGDALDMYVLKNGSYVVWDFANTDCPSVTFTAQSGVTYMVWISANVSGVSGFSVNVN